LSYITHWILFALTFIGGWHFGRTTQDLPAPAMPVLAEQPAQGPSACTQSPRHERLAANRF
jgi:hypothetical protein